MADVYLPEDHSSEDLALAARLALVLARESLVVCWSLDGHYFERTAPDPSA